MSGIVKEHGLDETFLKRLDNPEDHLVRRGTDAGEVKAKQVAELPPFILVSKAQYSLSMTIIEKLDNPYLQFSRSPEEMLLSVTLYAANSSFRSRDLLRHDFETLLLYQRAREELLDLENRLRSLSATASQGQEEEDRRGRGSQPSSLPERINQLQTFVARVENTESRTE